MGLGAFLDSLTAIHSGDIRDWEAIRNRLVRNQPEVIWNGSSGFDFHPLVGDRLGGVPSVIQKELGPNILYLMTDYSTRFPKRLRKLYDDLDEPDVIRDISRRGEVVPDFVSLDVEEIILLRCTLPAMEEAQKRQIQMKAKGQHRGWCFRHVSDAEWQFAYLRVSMEIEAEHRVFTEDVLVGCVENLFAWENLFVPTELAPVWFLATRVGGKSGSWCDLHDPHDVFMQSVLKSPPGLRPRFWGADRTGRLESLEPEWEFLRVVEGERMWRRIWPKPRCKDGYGLLQFYRCDWGRLERIE